MDCLKSDTVKIPWINLDTVVDKCIKNQENSHAQAIKDATTIATDVCMIIAMYSACDVYKLKINRFHTVNMTNSSVYQISSDICQSLSKHTRCISHVSLTFHIVSVARRNTLTTDGVSQSHAWNPSVNLICVRI